MSTMTRTQEQFLDQVAAQLVCDGIKHPTGDNIASTMRKVIDRQFELIHGDSHDATIFRRVIGAEVFHEVHKQRAMNHELDIMDSERQAAGFAELKLALKYGPDWKFS